MRTLPAKAIDLKQVGNHLAFQGIFNFLDYLFLATEFEVLNLPTRDTDKMMMMIGIMAVIVIKLTIGVNNLHDDSTLRKFFKIPVNGWKSNSFETGLQLPPNLFRTKVDKLLGENLQDCFSLWCGLEAKLLYCTMRIHGVTLILNRIYF
jgi:hypothetical protein